MGISTGLMTTGQGITAPLLPLYARSFDVSTSVVGLTFTVFAVARLLVNIPAGNLADRRGIRMLLVAGPVVNALGMIGSGLAVGIGDLMAWRFVAGAGSAMYMTAGQLYVLAASAPERRGRNLSINSGALLAGFAIGPAIGGGLAELGGLRMPFFVVGGLGLAAALYSFARLAEPERTATTEPSVGTRSATDPPPPGPSGSWGFLTSRGFVVVAAMSVAMFATRAGTRATLVPLLAVDELAMSEGTLGLAFGVSGVMGLILIGPAGIAADKVGRIATIVPMAVITIGGVLAVTWAANAWQLVVALLVLAVGTSATGPAQYSFLADAVPERDRGRAIGAYRSAGDIGLLAAPPLLGFVADQTSIDTALMVNAAMLAVVTVGFAVLAREPARTGTTTDPLASGQRPGSVDDDQGERWLTPPTGR